MPDQSPPNPLDTPRRASPFGLWPVGLFILAFVVWSGYWVYAANQLQSQLAVQQAALVKDGYQISVDPYKVGGWPYRLAVHFKHLDIKTPSGRGFATPELIVQAYAYDLDKWVVRAPSGLTLYRGKKDGVDLGTVDVKASDLRASISAMRQPVHNIAVVAAGLTLTPSDTTHPFLFTTADKVQAYMRPTQGVAKIAGDDKSGDILFLVENAHGAPGSMIGDLSPQAPLNLHIESTIRDITGLSDARAWAANGGQMTGFKTQITAGATNVMATSDALALDDNGALSGKMQIDVPGTAQPLEILKAARLISPENETLAEPLLDMGLSLGGAPKFTIEFKKGGAYIGPLKVSNAPILLAR